MTGEKLSSEEIKSRLVGILKDVDAFCKENGIRYYLAWGTMLGAVRHKGFIPWDDDIDLWMPRPDYDRFIQNWKHDIYTFHSPETDERWPLNFGKVCDERFTAPDRFGNDFGLFLDIFPLEGMPSDPKESDRYMKRVRRLENLWSNQLFTRKMSPGARQPLSLNAKILAGRLLHLLIPFRAIRARLNRLYTKYDFDTCSKTCSLSDSSQVYDKAVIDPASPGTFEGGTYPLPHDYDFCLRLRYGDYMQLPPEEERYSHEIDVRWKG